MFSPMAGAGEWRRMAGTGWWRNGWREPACGATDVGKSAGGYGWREAVGPWEEQLAGGGRQWKSGKRRQHTGHHRLSCVSPRPSDWSLSYLETTRAQQLFTGLGRNAHIKKKLSQVHR